MPKGFGKRSGTLLVSAALALASLSGPASAQWGPGYDTACVLYFRNWCANRWQVEGFATFLECFQYYSDLHCRTDWYS
ncbi:MAG: hypothetical protein ABWX67_08280 [Allosphingosinicella sp.]